MDEIILGSPEHEERDSEIAVHGDGHGDSGHGHEHADSGLEHGLEVSGHVHELEDSGHGSGVEASGGHEVHEHDECQVAVPVDRVASIWMVTRTDTASLRDRLSSLAQRLRESQAHPSEESENEGMPTGSRPRSSPCRLAMHGHSPAGQRPLQQMGSLASMQPVRLAASVPARQEPLDHSQKWWRSPKWNSKRSTRPRR